MVRINPDLIITGIWFIYAITMRLLPIEPSLFREISMVLLILFSKKKMRIKKMQILCLIFIMYYLISNIFNEGIRTGIYSSISMISWVITLMVFSSYSKTKKDIRVLINLIIISSFVVSAVVLANNKLFNNSVIVNLYNTVINRNTAIYFIFPGYLFQLLKLEKKEEKRLIDYLLLLFFLFVCIQINSRAMYFSIIISSLFIFNKKIIDLLKEQRFIRIILLLIVTIIFLFVIYKNLPKEYITREFRTDYEISQEGRIDLWKEAILMVKKPLFGMGGTYYLNNTNYSFSDYGAHNLFVDLYVTAGITAVILFIAIISQFVKNNTYIMAMIVPAFISMFVEAGRTYYPYMLLLIAWYIKEAAESEDTTINKLIEDIFNN